MDSQNLSEFDNGYKAGIAHAAHWIEQYIEARKSRLQPGKNQRKRDELEHIKKTLIRYIQPHSPFPPYPEYPDRKPTRPAIRANHAARHNKGTP